VTASDTDEADPRTMKLLQSAVLGLSVLGAGSAFAQRPELPVAQVHETSAGPPVLSRTDIERSDRSWRASPSGVRFQGRIDPRTDFAPPVLSAEEAKRFFERFIAQENAFYQEGVAYDGKTAVTFDGHAVSFEGGLAIGGPRRFSAASKESLHVAFLALAVRGDPIASRLLAPKSGEDPRRHALELLRRKIETYRAFDAEFPGFGGFLPWFVVGDGKIVPAKDWQDRVPGLDNGQLAWSLYLAEHILRDAGEVELAKLYRDRLELMARNVVRVFYDPKLRKMRAEATLVNGSGVPPERNRYATKNPRYMLDDPYEGTLLSEFATTFGDWRAHLEGAGAIWKQPRRERVTYRAPKSGLELTIDRGVWHSSHEQWAFGVLPYLDDPILEIIFENTQKARTINAAELREAGLAASANEPRLGDGATRYVNALGIRQPNVTKLPIDPRRIYTPYGAFPLGLVKEQRPIFATWLKMMSEAPGLMTELGIAESYSASGRMRAPLVTWDVKGLVALGVMGGLRDAMRPYMIADGIYDAFRARIAKDRSAFDGKPILGTALAPRGPSVRVPRPIQEPGRSS
jgi:hypothetical protein